MACGCTQVGRPSPTYKYEVLTDAEHFGTFDTPAEARQAQREHPGSTMRARRQ